MINTTTTFLRLSSLATRGSVNQIFFLGTQKINSRVNLNLQLGSNLRLATSRLRISRSGHKFGTRLDKNATGQSQMLIIATQLALF